MLAPIDFHTGWKTYADLTIQANMDVIEACQVQRFSNDKRLPLWQVECTATVSLHHAPLEPLRRIVMVVLGGTNGNDLAVTMLWWFVGMLVAELGDVSRNTSGEAHGIDKSQSQCSHKIESPEGMHGEVGELPRERLGMEPAAKDRRVRSMS